MCCVDRLRQPALSGHYAHLDRRNPISFGQFRQRGQRGRRNLTTMLNDAGNKVCPNVKVISALPRLPDRAVGPGTRLYAPLALDDPLKAPVTRDAPGVV